MVQCIKDQQFNREVSPSWKSHQLRTRQLVLYIKFYYVLNTECPIFEDPLYNVYTTTVHVYNVQYNFNHFLEVPSQSNA